MKNSSVQDVLKTFSEGGLVLIHDGLDSDNKAHLITSAEKITEESYKALKLDKICQESKRFIFSI